MNAEILLSCFQRIMSSDGIIRKNLESDLNSQSNSNPPLYLQASLTILHSHQKITQDLRLFCAIHLKSIVLENSFQATLNLPTFLQELSFLLKSEPNTLILSFLSEIYGEIAAKILKRIDISSNTELLNNDVWELLSMTESQRIVAGLDILTKLVEISLEELLTLFKDNLFSIIKKTLEFNEPNILKSATRLVARIISYAEYKFCKKFFPLVGELLEILFNFMRQNIAEGEQILCDLYEVAESEPRAFVPSFNVLLSKAIEVHSNQSISSGIKQQLLELILSIIERIPKKLPLSPQSLEGVFQMIFLHMMSLNEIQEYDSFSGENDCEFESVRFGLDAIDRVISSFGGKPVLEIFSLYIQRLLQMSDWRFTFAALMGLSQVGEYLDEINEIEKSLELSLNFVTHPHPMIRYAVCHTLGQLADDMKPEFQMKYHQRILPLLLNVLHDKSLLVAGHGSAALVNFIDGMNLMPLSEYLPTLVPELLICIEKTEGKFREQSILALSKTSKISRDKFQPYLKASVDLMFQIITGCGSDKWKSTRGKAIGTIAQIGLAVGLESFIEYLKESIRFLQMEPGVVFEIFDLTIAWRRLLGFIEPEILVKYMSHECWESILAMPSLSQGKPQEFEDSLKLLQLFLEKMHMYMLPHLEKVSTLLIPLTNSENSNNVRIRALKGIPFLIKMLLYGGKIQQANAMVNGLLDLMLKINEEKLDLEVRSELIRVLIEILQQELDSKKLQQAEFHSVIKLAWDNIEISISNKLHIEQRKQDEEDLDEDQEELLNDEIKAEKSFLLLVGDLLSVIFKKYENYLLEFKIIDNFLLNLAPKALDCGLLQFVVFTLDDLLDSVSNVELLLPHKNSIYNILFSNAMSKNCEIRQASVYGLGVFVEKFKDLEVTLIENIRLTLIDAIKIKLTQENNRKNFGACKDNAVSALGKLFRSYHENINLKQTIQIWLEGLPIKYDIKEAIIQYELLFGLLNTNPNSIIMDSSDNLERIFKIIGEIYGTELIDANNRELILKFVKNIMNLKNYDFEKFGQRFKELNPLALTRLEQCFKDVSEI